MSGQMTNGEIEDVLASIRRLLRDDETVGIAEGSARPRTRRLVLNPDSMVPGDAAAASPRAEVLVLTDPKPGTGPDDLGKDSAWSDEAGDAEPSWNAPLILSDPVLLPRPSFVAGTVAGAGYGSSVQPGPPGTFLRASEDDADSPGSDKRSSLEERIAELEAALTREEAEWEADGGDPEVFASVRHLPSGEGLGGPATAIADVSADTVPVEAGPAGGDDPAASDESEVFDDPGVPAPPRPRMSEDEVRAWIEAEALSAFGTSIGELVGEPDIRVTDAGDTPVDAAAGATAVADSDAVIWPSDTTDASTLAPEAKPWFVPDTRVTVVDDGSAENQLSGDGEAALGPLPGTMDAATAAGIRRIVSDVIRDELRGPLGEQLTRNIRRLVRRELAQARGSVDNT